MHHCTKLTPILLPVLFFFDQVVVFLTQIYYLMNIKVQKRSQAELIQEIWCYGKYKTEQYAFSFRNCTKQDHPLWIIIPCCNVRLAWGFSYSGGRVCACAGGRPKQLGGSKSSSFPKGGEMDYRRAEKSNRTKSIRFANDSLYPEPDLVDDTLISR